MSSEAMVNSDSWGLDGLCKAETWSMGVGKVLERPTRMEAIFYGSDGYQALEAMRHSGFELTSVGSLARIIWFGPFARKYVENPAHGTPFLTSSSMMEARPKATKLVSNKHTGHLPALRVHDGDILVSCSGTVGNVALCTKDVDGWACSQDAIRVIAHDPTDLGPLYCFLQSALGQFLLKRSQTGSVVRHIYEADVSGLPIPKLPLALRQELTERIRKVSALRVEANRLLDEAQSHLYDEFGDLREIGGRVANDPSVESHDYAFTTGFERLQMHADEEKYARLDAGFFCPAGLSARAIIKEQSRWAYLGDIARLVLIGKTFVPGVRKVDHEYGTPYFTGKELFRFRLSPSTFIGGTRPTHVQGLIVRKGDTLVTCAGTAGKVAHVGDELAGSAVTHDAIRVRSLGKVHDGFLFAFLSGVSGQLLLKRCTYGSVHTRLHDSQLARIPVPLPDDGGLFVGQIVERAFENRSAASDIESRAIVMFLTAVEAGCDSTCTQWGH